MAKRRTLPRAAGAPSQFRPLREVDRGNAFEGFETLKTKTVETCCSLDEPPPAREDDD